MIINEVIAIFDIGKTNKKILLFNSEFQVVYQKEQQFNEIPDDDGFQCDDIEEIEKWMVKTIQLIVQESRYDIKAINFSTYGASLVYIDRKGKRLTPLYNYLKPFPEDVLVDFYKSYGGVEEFSRKTASPPLGMLNSGLQILWLKNKKREVFSKTKYIMHLPQYFSYYFTGEITTDYTSIGCHTAMWDFDKSEYHTWLREGNIALTTPLANFKTFPYVIKNQLVPIGIGIHDSSSSLVPYLTSSDQRFILMSTGTWCIIMNPFNDEPLTAEQLKKDTLCYLSAYQKQIKSSRIFLGHILNVNIKRLTDYFKVSADYYQQVKPDEELLSQLLEKCKQHFVFFKAGIPSGYIDDSVDLSRFTTFTLAYHQLTLDISRLAIDALNLVVAQEDDTEVIYISGGFARNELFVRLLATSLSNKKVFTSEVDNASALGAALVIGETINAERSTKVNLGLKEAIPFNIKY